MQIWKREVFILDKRKGRKAIRQRHATVSKIQQYTIEQAIDLFIHAKVTEGLKERTIRDHKNSLLCFKSWLQEQHSDIKHVNEITTHVIREYVYYLMNERQLYDGHPYKPKQLKRENKLKASTLNMRVTRLKVFFNFLVNENIILTNPADKIKKLRVEEDTIGAFTDEQVELLLAQPDRKTYVGNRDYIIMRLMLETGMRINEVLSLRVSNIDFQTRLITLTGAQNKNRRVRVIPISKDMVRLLMDLIAENQTYFPDTEHVFLANYGEPLAPRSIAHNITVYGEKAGIAGQVRVSPHTFRHTFALNFLKSGSDIIALQRILGHSTMDMVRKYVQHTPDDLLASHDRYVMHLKMKHKKRL
jgi:integrase/recombinase XerD